MPRPTAGPPHGPSPIVPPPDRPCEPAAALGLRPVTGTCPARRDMPLQLVLARHWHGRATRAFSCLITEYNVQRRGLDAVRGYFFSMPTQRVRWGGGMRRG